MCVCVCIGIHVLKIFVERFWEFNILIGSLVKLHAWLHSCLCFSLLEKLFWKACSTPSRYLAICRAFWAFSYCNLDSSSTPGGSIELLFLNLILCCSILSQYLSCRRPVSWHLPRQLPRNLPIPQLSRITKGSIYTSIAILLSFLRSLYIYLCLFIS